MNTSISHPIESSFQSPQRIDLHVHSTFSDGTNTPKEIAALAHDIGLTAIALTDHDCVKGIPPMAKSCAHYNIEFVPGIEISCDYKGQEIHMLGYYIDPSNYNLNHHLEDFLTNRETRNHTMISNLNEIGFEITYNALYERYPKAVLTRAHIARYLVDSNQVKDMNHAFNYIGDGKSCFVKRSIIPIEDAINLIHSAGGLAVIAHPTLYHMKPKELDCLMSSLLDDHLDGIESIYSTYSVSETNQIKALAQKYDLLRTGGSDYHGTNKPFIHLGTGRGQLFIPYLLLEQMKKTR